MYIAICVIWKYVCDLLELFVVRFLFIFLDIFCNVFFGKNLVFLYCILLFLIICHDIDFVFLGPCPPCPKTVHSSCYCGRSKAIMRRCSKKEWSCGKPCNLDLSCGHHKCAVFCHVDSTFVYQNVPNCLNSRSSHFGT